MPAGNPAQYDCSPLRFSPGLRHTTSLWVALANGRNFIDPNQPGYRIVVKVIAHAPYHGIIRRTGYTGDDLPDVLASPWS